MSSAFHADLSNNLGSLLDNEIEYNVVIKVGKDAGYKEFHAHSIILRSRSSYFQNLFSSDTFDQVEKQDGMLIIKFPNISMTVFKTVLAYIYTGNIDLIDKEGNEIFKILSASYTFALDILTKFTEKNLIENHSEYLKKHPVELLQSILDNEFVFQELQELCLSTICYKPEILFHANDFTKLPAPLLEIIFKRDDLNLVEIEIWENLIKWGIAQVSREFDYDPNKWADENFKDLERNVHKLIPLIRFYEISSEDYSKRIVPYEEIIPKELKQDILQFYMAPGHIPNPKFKLSSRFSKSDDFDSMLLNQEQFITLANWIDNKDDESAYIKNIPYNFKLIYRKLKNVWAIFASTESSKFPDLNSTSVRDRIGSSNDNIFIIACKFYSQNDRSPHSHIGTLGGYINNNNWKDDSKNFLFHFEPDNKNNITRSYDGEFATAFDKHIKNYCENYHPSYEILQVEKVNIINTLKVIEILDEKGEGLHEKVEVNRRRTKIFRFKPKIKNDV